VEKRLSVLSALGEADDIGFQYVGEDGDARWQRAALRPKAQGSIGRAGGASREGISEPESLIKYINPVVEIIG
jgi:hypothetical protein